jgi:DNA-binding CsgD family transcriptional regulator/tetratricopeptide (TPR) repeat protein
MRQALTDRDAERASGHRLVGRDAELAVLDGLIAQGGSRGDAIALLGDPGIGKTSLLRAAATRARESGFTVLETAGVETETLLPYAGLHQLLRPVLGQAGALPPRLRRALLAAFGEGGRTSPEPFFIALAALNLLAEVSSRRPVLVAADDVHWLDQPTQDALAFLARRVSQDPVVIVAAMRTGHRGPFLAAGLPELEVGRLDDASAREVLAVRAAGLSAASQERILGEAVGNPLALVELPLAWRAAGAPGLDCAPALVPLTARLERAFASRIAGLPPVGRDAVLVAALGSASELPEILAATSVLAKCRVAADVMDEACAAGLIHIDAMDLRFRHPLVRSAVAAAEPPARRRAAHAALADVLTGEPDRRIWHRAQSIITPDDEVADELEASHRSALRRGSAMSAIWALERSAQLTADPARRGRRLLLAAQHAFAVGRTDLVGGLLKTAARSPLSAIDRSRMEWLREIFDDGVPGDAARVSELCAAAGRSARAGDLDLALNLLLGAGLRCWWADTGPAARALVASTVRELPAGARDPRYVAALAVAEPVLQGSAVIGMLSSFGIEDARDADALRLLGMAAFAAGDLVRGADFLDRAETVLRDQGRLGLLNHVVCLQAPTWLSTGDWEKQIAASAEGRRLAQETGQPIWTTQSLLVEAVGQAHRGHPDEALELAARAEQMASGRHLNALLSSLRRARGCAWISRGRYQDAYDELRRAFDPADPSYHPRVRFASIMLLAEAAVRCGERDGARAVIAGLERVAAVTPAPILHVYLLHARAVLADDADAEDLYRTAMAHDLTRWPWPRAMIELAYGRWLRRQRRVAQARPPLRSALTTLNLIGARSWAEQARAELRATGERPPPAQTSAADTLSPQELQIARLAAQGLSNREIGQRLYLSHRTVGSHLYRIFPKLDITSRTQLASCLGSA